MQDLIYFILMVGFFCCCLSFGIYLKEVSK
jgi:hypothetical protein